MKRTVAFLQMNTVEGDPQRNRDEVRAAGLKAKERGADILALPELWCSGYDLARASRELRGEQDFDFLADLSRDLEIAILGGSLLESSTPDSPAETSLYNAAVAYERGEELTRYRKLHLFGPLEEDRYLEPGEEVPRSFMAAGVRCGVSVCYDLRFPEVYRGLARSGVELIFVPAQWPSARIDHWRALLVARAVESQAYVLGVNRRGRFRDVEFGGHSQLVSPWGEIMVDSGEETGLFSGTVDTGEVARIRESYPYLNDCRTDIFSFPGSEE